MRWLARLFRRDRFERELDEELAFHIEAHTRDLIAEGVPPDAARRRALATFGGTAPIKELTRDANRARWLADFAADLSYAARTLRHQPGFAIVAILTLTLGIGANTAIFSMVNAVLLRPLPVREPEQLVLFSDDVSQGTRTSTPFPGGRWQLFSSEVYDFLRARPWPFESIAAFEDGDFSTDLEVPGRPVDQMSAGVSFVSGNYFDTLGARAALGRALMSMDDRPEATPAVVVSHHFWREHLDADPDVLGRIIRLDMVGTWVACTVVGVMPESFFGVRLQQAPDVWAPLSLRDGAFRRRTELYWLSLIGRLGEAHTIATAETSVNSALRQFLSSQTHAPNDVDAQKRIDSVHVRMADGSRGISVTRRENARLLVLLLSAVGVILLIACANVGTLFLARAAAREREVAVRRALGASRGRLIRQWLTESALLGGLGAVCGAALAGVIAPRLLATFVPAHVPMSATIDGLVLAFTTAITLLACLLFGLAPSLSAGRVDPVASLRLGGRSHQRRCTVGMAEPFVVAQIAMSLVLVVGAALLVRTLLNLQQQPFGFDQDRVLLAGINPRPAGYQPDTVGELYRRIAERLGALPGVERVSFARYAPFSGSISSSSATVEGYTPAPGERVSLETILVGPDYPQTIGMRLLAGRAFTFDDTGAAPRVAMVNEAFARRFFPTTGAIGRHFSLSASRERSYEVVGVVEDAHFRAPREPVAATVFLPMLQEPTGRILDAEFEIRTRADTSGIAGLVREAIGTIDANVEIRRIRTLREQVLATFGPERSAAGFIGAFAVLALLVASVGLYGVVSHGLARRTNEIGVRIALGAARLDVVRLVARETLLRLGLGLAIGFVLARAAGGFLSIQLFGITPYDPWSVAVAALVLSLVVALTTVRPLARATRVDPVVALRAE